MKNNIQQAVKLLKAGKLVAIPTETVYGLAADASNAKAVEQIFKVKGRPIGHPIIVHVADSTELKKWAINIPEDAYKLAKAFWPGPLTFILKRSPFVLDIVTGGQDTVGLRCPSHPVTQKILKAFNGGLAAPSANRFGRISPTTAQAVYEELGEKVDLIVDGGSCDVGVESTILDLSSDVPKLLRPGMINYLELEKVLGKKIELNDNHVPRISGSLPSHYAPLTQTKKILSKALIEKVSQAIVKGQKIAVLSLQNIPNALKTSDKLIWRKLPKQSEVYARKLYQNLRELDALTCDKIYIEEVPQIAEWSGIADRINRATFDKR